MGQKKNRLNDGDEAKQSYSYTHTLLDSPNGQMYSSTRAPTAVNDIGINDVSTQRCAYEWAGLRQLRAPANRFLRGDKT